MQVLHTPQQGWWCRRQDSLANSVVALAQKMV